MKKKKILVAALVVALLAIAVSGTLAYFTAEDKAENTFTVGSVRIDIWENDQPTDKETVMLDGRLQPVVDDSQARGDLGYIEKVVKVKNVGINEAYIRTHIAMPTALVGYLVPDMAETDAWQAVRSAEASVGGVPYTVYTYDHTEPVKAAAFTAELLQGAYLKSAVDARDNPATPAADLEFCILNDDGTYTYSGYVAHSKLANGYQKNTVPILVVAEAIQVRNLESLGATGALDTGFGTGTPWD